MLQISTEIVYSTITLPVRLTLITLYTLYGIIAIWWPQLCFYVLYDNVFIVYWCVCCIIIKGYLLTYLLTYTDTSLLTYLRKYS